MLGSKGVTFIILLKREVGDKNEWRASRACAAFGRVPGVGLLCMTAYIYRARVCWIYFKTHGDKFVTTHIKLIYSSLIFLYQTMFKQIIQNARKLDLLLRIEEARKDMIEDQNNSTKHDYRDTCELNNILIKYYVPDDKK